MSMYGRLVDSNNGGGDPLGSLNEKKKKSSSPTFNGVAMQAYQLVVPMGIQPGQSFLANIGGGAQVQVTVPDGCGPGSILQVEAPAPDWRNADRFASREALVALGFDANDASRALDRCKGNEHAAIQMLIDEDAPVNMTASEDGIGFSMSYQGAPPPSPSSLPTPKLSKSEADMRKPLVERAKEVLTRTEASVLAVVSAHQGAAEMAELARMGKDVKAIKKADAAAEKAGKIAEAMPAAKKEVRNFAVKVRKAPTLELAQVSLERCEDGTHVIEMARASSSMARANAAVLAAEACNEGAKEMAAMAATSAGDGKGKDGMLKVTAAAKAQAAAEKASTIAKALEPAKAEVKQFIKAMRKAQEEENIDEKRRKLAQCEDGAKVIEKATRKISREAEKAAEAAAEADMQEGNDEDMETVLAQSAAAQAVEAAARAEEAAKEEEARAAEEGRMAKESEAEVKAKERERLTAEQQAAEAAAKAAEMSKQKAEAEAKARDAEEAAARAAERRKAEEAAARAAEDEVLEAKKRLSAAEDMAAEETRRSAEAAIRKKAAMDMAAELKAAEELHARKLKEAADKRAAEESARAAAEADQMMAQAAADEAAEKKRESLRASRASLGSARKARDLAAEQAAARAAVAKEEAKWGPQEVDLVDPDAIRNSAKSFAEGVEEQMILNRGRRMAPVLAKAEILPSPRFPSFAIGGSFQVLQSEGPSETEEVNLGRQKRSSVSKKGEAMSLIEVDAVAVLEDGELAHALPTRPAGSQWGKVGSRIDTGKSKKKKLKPKGEHSAAPLLGGGEGDGEGGDFMTSEYDPLEHRRRVMHARQRAAEASAMAAAAAQSEARRAQRPEPPPRPTDRLLPSDREAPRLSEAGTVLQGKADDDIDSLLSDLR